jgi:primosomal protein N'
VPRACPDCGNLDIGALGRGTEQLEEHLGELLAGVTRPDGTPIRIARIDADTTRSRARSNPNWRRCTQARWTCWSARR